MEGFPRGLGLPNVVSAPSHRRPGTGELVYVAHLDDEAAEELAASMRELGYIAFAFHTPNELLDQVEAEPPHLVLMSHGLLYGAGGLLTQVVRARAPQAWFPIALAVENEPVTDDELQAADVDDFIEMPAHHSALALRVGSLIRLRHKHDAIEGQSRQLISRNTALQDELQARNDELERLTLGLVGSLERANLFNDEDTGNHIRRVCGFSGLIARRAGLPRALCDKIFRYSSLHDVGKVGIPDSILKKRGALTQQELEVMRRHTLIGYELLDASGVDTVAKNIAIGHHERWNGSGYPRGLREDDIPLEARIVAIADVFDALTSERCYKEAYPRDRAVTVLRDGSGLDFDPGLTQLFLGGLDEVFAIQDRFRG